MLSLTGFALPLLHGVATPLLGCSGGRSDAWSLLIRLCGLLSVYRCGGSSSVVGSLLWWLSPALFGLVGGLLMVAQVLLSPLYGGRCAMAHGEFRLPLLDWGETRCRFCATDAQEAENTP